MNTIDELITEIRSLLARKPVSYQEIARVLYEAPFTQEHLRDVIYPILSAHLGRKKLSWYKIKEEGLSVRDPTVGLVHYKTEPFEPEELDNYVKLLLGGFSGMVKSYFGDEFGYPSDTVPLPESLYVISANYDSGNTFGRDPDNVCTAGIIQGYKPMKRYMELLAGRDSNRMTNMKVTDPEYPLHKALGLHQMQPWEGYFEHLNFFYVSVVMDVKGPS